MMQKFLSVWLTVEEKLKKKKKLKDYALNKPPPFLRGLSRRLVFLAAESTLHTCMVQGLLALVGTSTTFCMYYTKENTEWR